MVGVGSHTLHQSPQPRKQPFSRCAVGSSVQMRNEQMGSGSRRPENLPILALACCTKVVVSSPPIMIPGCIAFCGDSMSSIRSD